MFRCGIMQRFPLAKLLKPSSLRMLGSFTIGLFLFTWLLSAVMPRWDIDLAFSHLWWHAPHSWFSDRSTVCWFLNEFGPLPGVLLACGGAVVLTISLLRRQMRHLTAPALYLVLAFLLGPGLLVNGVLKHSWSRTRPKETVEFGRKEPYERVFTHVSGSHGRSFPSGHASTAFFLCSLGFASAVWGTRQGVWAGLLLGVSWGVLVGWSRIASGAHFLSDVLWSAVLVNAVNYFALLPFIVRDRGRRPQPVSTLAHNPMAKYS